ncbi:MAG: hypothetical protein H7Y01_09585 [Ferruginibacter sp.]|nr:hypothetical protein [Chitinophagaceae bacterium]
MKYLLIALAILVLFSCEKYEPTEGAFKDDFILTLRDTAGVKADGISSVTLRLSNTLEVKEGLRVLFDASKGTVLVKEQPYKGPFVETKLLLTEDTGTYSLTAKLMDGKDIIVEKFITVSFPALYQPSQYNLTVTDSAGVRNNSSSRITVKFSGPVSFRQGLTVHFDNIKGTLLQSDLAYQNGVAQTSLKVDQDTGTYILKAQLRDGASVKFEKVILFSFRAANAETILLEASSSTWNAPDPITVKTLLTRADGKVTTGRQVFYRSYQVLNLGDTTNAGRLEGLLNNVSAVTGLMGDIKMIPDTQGMDITRAFELVAKTITDRGDTIRTYIKLPHQ